jgi:hypothetical protein
MLGSLLSRPWRKLMIINSALGSLACFLSCMIF